MLTDEAVIFVVDDDEAVRDSFKLLLESYGLEVEVYASTEDFSLNYQPHDRECLILDQHLQGAKTGLDFLLSIAEARIRVPVILMTARGDAALRARALEAGAMAYLDKPLDEMLLMAAIDASTTRLGRISSLTYVLSRISRAVPVGYSLMQINRGASRCTQISRRRSCRRQ